MFVALEEVLNPIGLHKPTLAALAQDAALYSCLLFQRKENLAYGDDFIRIIDQHRAIAK